MYRSQSYAGLENKSAALIKLLPHRVLNVGLRVYSEYCPYVRTTS